MKNVPLLGVGGELVAGDDVRALPKRKLDTAATIPGPSGHDISSRALLPAPCADGGGTEAIRRALEGDVR